MQLSASTRIICKGLYKVYNTDKGCQRLVTNKVDVSCYRSAVVGGVGMRMWVGKS